MSTASATSLVIATYNWPEALRQNLLSVARQTVMPAEVIVADDGSDNRTAAVIAEMKTRIPVPLVHVWQEDVGFRKSLILNKSIGQSVGKYVIQVDGDVLLHRCFVADHIAAAESGAFVRGTRARLTPSRTNALLGEPTANLHWYSAGVYNRFNALRLPVFQSVGSRKEMSSQSVRGSNLAFWKSDFLDVNGYNNALSGWGHEDEELAARLINKGIVKKIVKLSAIQYHLHHNELPRNNESYHRTIIQNTLQSNLTQCLDGYEKRC